MKTRFFIDNQDNGYPHFETVDAAAAASLRLGGRVYLSSAATSMITAEEEAVIQALEGGQQEMEDLCVCGGYPVVFADAYGVRFCGECKVAAEAAWAAEVAWEEATQ